MSRTESNPTRLILGGRGASDVTGGHEMDEAPAVIIPGDVGVGGQDGMLAVGAEHFGRTIPHCLDLGQSVFTPQIFA
jgi:hypothetical protein